MSVGATWHEEGSGWLIRAGADTQIGGIRERNEDFVLLDPDIPLALVIDGMGGESGAQAARIGAEAIRDRVRIGTADEPPEALLEAAFRAGHVAVLRLHADPELRGCGATVVASWVQSERVYVTWLGDARAYRLAGGRVEQLTHDHDLRTFLLRSGRMTEAEARYARIRNVLLRYLGSWSDEDGLEFSSFAPLPGDRLILATDGVSSVLETDVFLTACQTISDPATCAEAIVEHALMAGSRDNCSCTVLAFDPTEPSHAPAMQESPRKRWRFWA